jgi:ribosomal protein L29
MAILKAKEISKLAQKDRESKLKELRFELIKSSVTANKANSKTKEIKRTISRLITFSKSRKEASTEALNKK